ncbi:MAG: cytochrome c oxidase subunit II [Candidatus Aminicenantales bacterium]
MFAGAAASTAKVDSAFFLIIASAGVLLVAVMAVMIVFLIRYGKKKHPHPDAVRESTALEIVWTVIPLLLVMLMFYLGWVDFEYIRNAPKDAMQVDVTARQWTWLFRYPNGKEDGVLRAPLGKPVKLVMTSLDVLHCLFIPAFRIKEDCVPGIKTHMWFRADELGSYQLFCSEYCGLGHSHMRSQVIVMPPADFDRWYQAAEETGAAALGSKALKTLGCLGCHSLDGTRSVGPTFKGLVGSSQVVITGGAERTMTVDAAYVRQYILNPNQDVVKGYSPIMPKLKISDQELDAIVAYLETLK